MEDLALDVPLIWPYPSEGLENDYISWLFLTALKFLWFSKCREHSDLETIIALKCFEKIQLLIFNEFLNFICHKIIYFILY